MITNKNNYPEALRRAIENDSYNNGDSDYTITGLLKPPRIAELTRLHSHEIEEDVEDGLYRLYGQLIHALLDRANMADLSEKRFYGTFSGKKISAQVDTLCLENGILSDYKFTTVWKFKKDKPPDPEYTAQLNVQAELLRLNGYEPKKLQIIGLLRDWRPKEFKEFEGYPPKDIAKMPIEIWDRDRVTKFIEMRIAIHEAAKKKLPECTADERWATPDQWAVMKGKRAIPGGLQLSEENAQKLVEENPGTYIQYRAGKSKRCLDYCQVSKYCVQYQSAVENQGVENEI